MAYDRFVIAPINTGLETDLKSFLIPDDAFAQLNNAYVFRGRVRKRFGSAYTGNGAPDGFEQFYSRLRIDLGATDANGDINGTAPGSIFKVGQAFSIGSELFTVTALGNPAPLLTTGAATGAGFDTTTGVYSFTGTTPLAHLYFYPAEPVMGIAQNQIGAINNQPTYAFDTQFAYQYAGGFWQYLGPTPGSQWHGSNSDFFWTTTWTGIVPGQSVFFVTNFHAALGAPVPATDDPIWYYNSVTNAWAVYKPNFLVAGDKIFTARIILPFKDRLILLNTIEQNAAANTNTAYINRCRYSQNGSPLTAGAFLEPNQIGSLGGGFLDAPTQEEIVSAEFIKDRLIVYFEQSTWELAYTGNQVLPFVWQKINTELGSQATLSTVPFDKVVFTIGNVGVHACNGANVERIDNKIPNQIFEISNKDEGVLRVAGIRDYYTEMVYWTFPSSNESATQTYPNRVLVYNYKNGAWAFNDDCITAFGYFDQQSGTTWASSEENWQSSNFAWNSGVSSLQFRQILAGNQEGFVFIVAPDDSTNAPVMQMTSLIDDITINIIDHTLAEGEWIQFNNNFGISGINFYQIVAQVNRVVDKDTIELAGTVITGAYKGGTTVSRLSNIQIKTKQMNPYREQGKNVYLAKVDFYVQRTSFGQITVDYFPSSSSESMINLNTGNNTNMGNNILETSPYSLVPLESTQDQLWHPVYFDADGDNIQLYLYMSADQLQNTQISGSDFVLDAMVLYTMPISRLQ